MWAAVIPGREAWGACELRLKLSRRMGVGFKDEPRYKLTPTNPMICEPLFQRGFEDAAIPARNSSI